MNQFPSKNYFTMPNESFHSGWTQVRSQCMPIFAALKTNAPISAG